MSDHDEPMSEKAESLKEGGGKPRRQRLNFTVPGCKLLCLHGLHQANISKWKTVDCLVMQHRGDRLFLCFYYWRQPSPSLPFQVTKAAVGLPQYEWEIYLVSVSMKYTVQKNKGICVGPSLVLTSEKNREVLIWLLSDLGEVWVTSHTWFSESKSIEMRSKSPCYDSTAPWLCIVTLGKLPANRHAKALHGHVLSIRQIATSPRLDRHWHKASGQTDTHTRTRVRALINVGSPTGLYGPRLGP